MRKIKFRAWNTQEKKMFYLSEKIHLHLGGFGGWTFSCPENTYACSPDDILMQYTGLKDKHLKEIYEGDILDFGKNNVAQVIWQIYEWLLDFGKYQLKFGLGGNGYIIGNICENPELLDKNQGEITND